jgi:hypothetical protein
MKLEQIEDLMDKYDFDFILEQFNMNKLEVLSLLNDLGYINLESMVEEE